MNQLIKEIGKKGHITYKYKNKYIYSTYDPINEAKRFLDAFSEIKRYVITCCGADYINSLLLKEEVDLILSFEPLKFDNNIDSDKIIRIKNIEEIEKKLLEKNIHSRDISLIIWQPLIESMPDIYLKPLKQLQSILYKTSISANTAYAFGFKESFNFIINLLTTDNFSYLRKSSNNNNKLKNLAMIISSGASLKYNIDFIKKTSEKSFIFALPSALPYLSHNEICPDFVIVVDPGYGTYYHLVKYRKNITLISPLTIIPNIFNLKNITPIIFNYCTHLENILFNNLDIVATPAEGSVFINLLRILPQIGFSDVILIGQDFGYMDNRSHINEGSFEREYLQNAGYYRPLEMFIKTNEEMQEKADMEIMGNKIKTNAALKIYHEHFIKKEFGIKFFLPINCFNPLSEKFEKIKSSYILEKYDKKKSIQEIFSIHAILELEKKKEEIINILKKINNNSGNVELLKNIFADKENINHANKLKKLIKALK